MTIQEDFLAIKSEDIACVDDSSFIWEGEHHRSPMTTEHKAENKTPIFIMVPFMIRQLENPKVKSVLIDGTGEHFSLSTEGEDGIVTYTAKDIVINDPLPADQVKTPLELYFKTYYLLRYYLFGGSKKYAVDKVDEGFMVYAKDTEHSGAWAKHKVY